MIDLEKHSQVPDGFFHYTPPAAEAAEAAQVSELESELKRLDTRTPDLTSCQSSSSSHSSHSGGSSTSSTSRAKFQHYHEPTVLDRPEAVDAARSAIVAQDRDGLARVARQYGLPPLLRTDAWPLLLRGHPYVVSQQPPEHPVLDTDLPLRRVRSDVRRLCQARGVSALHETAVFTALLSFLRVWGAKITYEKPMAWIAMYLAMGDSDTAEDSIEFTGIKAEDLSRVFTDVMLVFTHEPVPFSDFIGEMRAHLPDLAQHFYSESILSGNLGGDGWLVWWLKWFGIRALPSSAMARMWDVYFAMTPDEHLELTREHIFNCLVVMKEHRGKLLELDQSECRQFLAAVPTCNDDEAVVNEARILERDSTIK